MFLTGYTGFDNCFCASDCTNIKCDRCEMSKHYADLQKFLTTHKYYNTSYSDFRKSCECYQRPVTIILDDTI